MRIFLACLFTSGLSLSTHSGLAAAKFRAVEIDKIQIGYGVTVADVDGDKKPDILLVDKNQVAWFHNPDWKKHVTGQLEVPLMPEVETHLLSLPSSDDPAAKLSPTLA